MVRRALVLSLLLLVTGLSAGVNARPTAHGHVNGAARIALVCDNARAISTVERFARQTSQQFFDLDTARMAGGTGSVQPYYIHRAGVWFLQSRSNAAIELHNNGAAANQLYEVWFQHGMRSECGVSIMTMWQNCKYTFGASVSAIVLSGDTTETAVAGIQIGTPYNSSDTGPPWDDPATSSSWARLGYTPYTDKVFVECGAGDGVAGTYTDTIGKIACGGVGDNCADMFFEIIYDPYVPSVSFYVNHVLVKTVTDTDVLPQYTAAENPVAGGFFVESGATSGTVISAVFKCPYSILYHPSVYGVGATLWY
jgi:hypothetical protein